MKPLAPAGHSVWLEWEAESTGIVTVSTCGSAMPTIVGVYQGSGIEHLTELGSVFNSGPECTPISHGVSFQAIAGLKYEIVVDGDVFFMPPGPQSTGEGAISLRIEATPPPANDNFANAADLVGRTTEEPGGQRFYFGETFGYNWAATSEAGEPVRRLGPEPPSVWYRWTAPETGPARINANGAFGRQIWLGVYTGQSLESLQAVGADADFVEFSASAGTTYRVVVDGAAGEGAGAMSTFGLWVAMILAPRPAPAQPPIQLLGDLQPPETRLGKRKVRMRSARFAFAASEAGSTFHCRLDRRKETSCASPKTYAGLAAGRHTFKVRAIDAAGNSDPTTAATSFIVPAPRRHG